MTKSQLQKETSAKNCRELTSFSSKGLRFLEYTSFCPNAPAIITEVVYLLFDGPSVNTMALFKHIWALLILQISSNTQKKLDSRWLKVTM